MVSAVSSDNKKSDEYWMGVRDALRMVDSFSKWAERNPNRAKKLDDFIHDGLIAAAKRCESCLSEKLGLSFSEEDEEEQIDSDELLVQHEESPDYETSIEFEESPKTEDEIQEFESTPPSADTSHWSADDISSYEMSPDEESRDTENKAESIPEASEEIIEPPSIDGVARRDDEDFDDIETDGPPRDFSTDFDLVEPTPLVVETHDEDADTVPSEDEAKSTMAEYEEELEVESEPDEAGPERPSFTWSDYEAAVTPSESELEDSDAEVLSPLDEAAEEEQIEDDEITEPPEPPKVWSAEDESFVSDEEETSFDETEEDEIESDSSASSDAIDDEVDVTKPPPPPPPPESEEDEEERKRRARRLFFGA